VKSALPRGPGLDFLALAVDEIPVQLTTAGINIHLGNCEPSLALPEVTCDPESTNDEEGKVSLEKILGCASLLAGFKTKRRNGSVKLVMVLACMYCEMRRWRRKLTCAMRTMTMIPIPSHDPATPPAALNGISSTVWPWYAQALRKRMWDKQMEPQVKSAARPDRATNQSKTVLPVAARFM
jgi:hypothetical protein